MTNFSLDFQHNSFSFDLIYSGIANHKPLHHVDEVHDTSAPQIDPDVKVKKNVRDPT